MIDEASDESDQSSAVQSIPVIEAYQQAVALPDTVSRRKAWIAAVFFNFLKVITVAGMQSVAVYVLEVAESGRLRPSGAACAKWQHTDRLQNPAKLRRFRIGGGIGAG